MNPKAVAILVYLSALSLCLSLMGYQGQAIAALVAFGAYVVWAVLR